jgi:hypothetical protein
MRVLTAYLDESGYGAKDIIVVGGFFGNDREWHLCDEQWKAALGKRKSLHMKDLRWGKKNERTKLLLEKLGPIPRRCGLVPVWVRFKVSDYSDLVDNTTASRKLQHGYFLGAQFIALMLLWYMRELNERVKVVFEANEHFASIVPLILKLYGEVFSFSLEDGMPCLTGVEFISKDSSCLTQPADYLTYARLQELRDLTSLRARLCAPILSGSPGLRADIGRNAVRQLMSSKSMQDLQSLGRQLEPHIRRARGLGVHKGI